MLMNDDSEKTISQLRNIMEDEKKKRLVPSKVKYIRLKEATEIFRIKKTKLSQMARDAKAAYKINGVLLIRPEEGVKIYRMSRGRFIRGRN